MAGTVDTSRQLLGVNEDIINYHLECKSYNVTLVKTPKAYFKCYAKCYTRPRTKTPIRDYYIDYVMEDENGELKLGQKVFKNNVSAAQVFMEKYLDDNVIKKLGKMLMSRFRTHNKAREALLTEIRCRKR